MLSQQEYQTQIETIAVSKGFNTLPKKELNIIGADLGIQGLKKLELIQTIYKKLAALFMESSSTQISAHSVFQNNPIMMEIQKEFLSKHPTSNELCVDQNQSKKDQVQPQLQATQSYTSQNSQYQQLLSQLNSSLSMNHNSLEEQNNNSFNLLYQQPSISTATSAAAAAVAAAAANSVSMQLFDPYGYSYGQPLQSLVQQKSKSENAQPLSQLQQIQMQYYKQQIQTDPILSQLSSEEQQQLLESQMQSVQSLQVSQQLVEQQNLIFKQLQQQMQLLQKQQELTKLKCLCECNVKLKENLTLPSEIVTCLSCEGTFHSQCVKVQPQSCGSSIYQCPLCVLSLMDPLSQIVEQLVTPVVINGNGCQLEFSIENSQYLQIGKKNYSVEIRCLRIDGSHNMQETTFPDSTSISINLTLIKEFKPLQQQSSLKKRKDDIVVIKDVQIIKKGLNIIEIKENINSSSQSLGKQLLRIDKDAIHVIGMFLTKSISQSEYIESVPKMSVENSKQFIIDNFHQKKQDKKSSAYAEESNCIEIQNKSPSQLDRIVDIDKVIVNLMCPFGFSQIKTPARGKFCKHIQCFSLENIIIFTQNTKPRKWKCPICKLKCFDLIIDEYLLELITNYNKEGKVVEEIAFNKNAEPSIHKLKDDSEDEKEEEQREEEENDDIKEEANSKIKAEISKELTLFSLQEVQECSNKNNEVAGKIAILNQYEISKNGNELPKETSKNNIEEEQEEIPSDENDFLSKDIYQDYSDKTETYSASMQEVEKYNKIVSDLKVSLNDTSKLCLEEVGFEDFKQNQTTPQKSSAIKQVSKTNRIKAIKNLKKQFPELLSLIKQDASPSMIQASMDALESSQRKNMRLDYQNDRNNNINNGNLKIDNTSTEIKNLKSQKIHCSEYGIQANHQQTLLQLNNNMYPIDSIDIPQAFTTMQQQAKTSHRISNNINTNGNTSSFNFIQYASTSTQKQQKQAQQNQKLQQQLQQSHLQLLQQPQWSSQQQQQLQQISNSQNINSLFNLQYGYNPAAYQALLGYPSDLNSSYYSSLLNVGIYNQFIGNSVPNLILPTQQFQINQQATQSSSNITKVANLLEEKQIGIAIPSTEATQTQENVVQSKDPICLED